MDLDLNLLKCFREVGRTESLTLAAQTLHLSQPAISIQIKKLEEQVGQKLFDRHSRGLTLNPFGRMLFQFTERLTDFETDLEKLIADVPTEPKGKVRLGTYTTASSYLLAAPLTELLKKHEQLTLSYHYYTSERIVDKIKDYSLECGVFSDVPADPALDIQPIVEDELILAQSLKRGKPKSKSVEPKDLSSLEFLSYPLRYDLCYRKVEQKFGVHLAKARVVAESESFDTLKQMLLQGAGVTFIPRYLVAKELERGEVIQLTLANTRLPIVFSFVTKKDAQLSLATRAVRDSILGCYKRSRRQS